MILFYIEFIYPAVPPKRGKNGGFFPLRATKRGGLIILLQETLLFGNSRIDKGNARTEEEKKIVQGNVFRHESSMPTDISYTLHSPAGQTDVKAALKPLSAIQSNFFP